MVVDLGLRSLVERPELQQACCEGPIESTARVSGFEMLL